MATTPQLVALLTKEMTGRALLTELESNHPDSVELIEKLKKPSECNPGANYTGPTMLSTFTALLQDQAVKDAFEPLRENMPASTLAERSFVRVQLNADGLGAGESTNALEGLDTGASDDLDGKIMTATQTLAIMPGEISAPADFTVAPDYVTIGEEGTYAIEALMLAMGAGDGATVPTFDLATGYDFRMFMVVTRPAVSTTVPFHVSEILTGSITRTNLSNAAVNGGQVSTSFLKSYSNTLHFLKNDKLQFVVQRGRQLATYGSAADTLVFPMVVDAMGSNPTRDIYNYIELLRIE